MSLSKCIKGCKTLKELIEVAERNKDELIETYKEIDFIGTAYSVWAASGSNKKDNGQFFTPSFIREEAFKLLPKNKSWCVCDIAGAGSGRLLESTSINIDQAFGIEIDPNLVAVAKHKGLNVVEGDCFLADKSEFPFTPNLYASNPAWQWVSNATTSRSGGNAAAQSVDNILDFAQTGDYYVFFLPLNALTGERETGFDTNRIRLLRETQIIGVLEYHDSVFLDTKIRTSVIVGRMVYNQKPYTFKITKNFENKVKEVSISNDDVVENRLNYDTYTTAIAPLDGPTVSFDDVVRKTSIHYKKVSQESPTCISLHNCSRPNECKTITEVNSPYTLQLVENFLLNSVHAQSIRKRYLNPGVKYNNVPLKLIRKYLRFPTNLEAYNDHNDHNRYDAPNVTLFWDDFLNAVNDMDDDSMDLGIIDPPYNISSKTATVFRPGEYEQKSVSEEWDTFTDAEFIKFNEAWIKGVLRKLKQNSGSAFVYGSHHNIYQIGNILQQQGARIINSIVWFKPNSPPNVSCRMLRDSVEHLIWFAPSSSKWYFDYQYAKSIDEKQLRNVWQFSKVAPREKLHGNHPTQKPENITERIIRIASKPGDKILIPFAGSGTEMKVGLELDRKVVGVELAEEYIALINRRLGNLFF